MAKVGFVVTRLTLLYLKMASARRFASSYTKSEAYLLLIRFSTSRGIAKWHYLKFDMRSVL
jgi:hypothetical protein